MHAPRMLHDVEIDWGWPELTEEERAIARLHEARLVADKRAHTIDSAQYALLVAGSQLLGRSLRMRAIDDEVAYAWQIVYPESPRESGPLHARGELYEGGDFDEAGMFPGELTADDFRAAGVTLVLTPLSFPDSMLRSMNDKAEDSISSLVADAWQSAADELPAGFRTPLGPRRMQQVYLPVEIWADLKDRAKAEDRSMSYLVQRAVTAAYALPVE